MSHNKKPVAVAIGAALAGGLVLSGSAFAMQPLAQGYMLAAASVAADAGRRSSCGAQGDGRLVRRRQGRPKASAAKASAAWTKMDTDKDGTDLARPSSAPPTTATTSKFAAHDTNSDGFISADEMKAHHAAKAAQGGEGKCGEGKCGGDKKADGAKAEGQGRCRRQVR